MLQRVIVHPGFHKTGTSSVQRALRAGRTDLAPLWQIGLEEDFPDAAAAARAYSLRRDPLDLGLFQQALADWIETLDLAGAEGLLLSCELLMERSRARPTAPVTIPPAPIWRRRWSRCCARPSARTSR